jgi:cytoskeletal protein RodZ
MAETLGEKLRQAREERGVSIAEVAEQTRISPHYIELIELDDYRTLPGGIFNKGFVKSFAKYVGIDESEALQDYSRLITAQTGTDANDDPKTYRPEVLTDDRASSSRLPTIIFAFVILGLLSGGIILGLNYYQSNPSTSNSTGNSNSAANANTANTINPIAVATPVVTDEIKFEFKPVSTTINVTYWADGKMTSRNVPAGETIAVNPQESLRVSYYRGFTPDKVQLTLNGKQIAAPAPPARGNVIFEVNKNNVSQIMQSGQIPAPASAAPAPR